MFKGYKTVIFNVIMFIATLVTLFTGVDVSKDAMVLQEGTMMVLIGLDVIWTIGGVWFRSITDTPIFSREVTYHYATKVNSKGK
jgi:hypothetical protein